MGDHWSKCFYILACNVLHRIISLKGFFNLSVLLYCIHKKAAKTYENECKLVSLLLGPQVLFWFLSTARWIYKRLFFVHNCVNTGQLRGRFSKWPWVQKYSFHRYSIILGESINFKKCWKSRFSENVIFERFMKFGAFYFSCFS